jgi:hypothetical protein
MSQLEEFAARARMVRRQARIDTEAAAAVRALEDSNVEVLLLKGPALARTLYRTGEHRGYFDIDLLVAPSSFGRARGAIGALGYRNVSELYGIDDVASILHSETWARAAEDFGNVTVDLHWRLDGCNAPAEESFGVLFADCDVIDLAGRPVRILSTAGRALHVALHAAQHGPTDLKAMSDLKLGLGRWQEDVWRGAAALAEILGGIEAFSAGLRLVPGGERLAAVLRLTAPFELMWTIANRDTRPRGVFHLQALADAGGTRRRLTVIRKALFPSRAWIRWEHRWAGTGPIALASAYAVHLARAPLWALRARRYRRRAQRLSG